MSQALRLPEPNIGNKVLKWDSFIAVHRVHHALGKFFGGMNRASGNRVVGALCGMGLVATNGGVALGGPIHGTVAFAPEGQLTSPTTLQPFLKSLIVADLNNDGWPDVAAVSQRPGMVAWYQNLGNGTFAPQRIISTQLGTLTGLFAGDLDSDGLIDLACSAFLENTVAWFKNIGGNPDTMFGTPGANMNIVSSVANSASSVTIGNLISTGGFDVLSTSASPFSRVTRHPNSGTGTFGPHMILSNAGLDASSVRVANLDGNAFPDLVVTSSADNTIAWFKGVEPVGGNPQFVRYVIANNQPRAATSSVADIDGDGWPDLLCASPFFGDAASGPGKRVTWFRNTTHDVGAVAPFFSPPQIITANVNGAYGIASADLNSDGRPDALAASLFDSKVTWYENLGGGNFGWNASDPTANEQPISTSAIEAVAVSAADFNLDGTIDVAVAVHGEGRILLYLNTGGQTALSSADTAPATIMNGAKDDVLRLAVTNRGIAGDNNAQLFSVSLLLEKSAGVAISSAEANALIENLQIFVDSNISGAFEPGADALVGTVDNLQLTAGRMVAPLAPTSAADAQISPASTRHFFVVARMTAEASVLATNTFRITHLGQGVGKTITKDALSGSTLTVETAANADAPSSFTTATPSIVQTWRQGWFSTISNAGNAADTANPDGDAFVNLAEFAFGLNPTTNSAGAIAFYGNVITPGAPAVLVTNTPTGVDFRALYGRRKDYAAAGLSYAVQFSADLASWTPSSDTPTVTADDGTLEAVTVSYPFFINGKKARFFRVVVTGP